MFRILKATFSKIEGRYDTQLLLYCVVTWPLFRVTGFSHRLLAAQKSGVFVQNGPRATILTLSVRTFLRTFLLE